MTPFTIYPAIDLRNGAVVRLQQGDPDRQTTYSNDPLAFARRWAGEGAEWLHVVNLDGAFDAAEASAANRAVLAKIASAVGLKIQFGGGVRSMADVQAAFDAGVTRVVIGTAAVEKPELVDAVLSQYGAESLIVGLDSKDGMLVTRGWQQATPISAIDYGANMHARGVRYALYTEVGRDGMMQGAAAELTAALAQLTGLSVLASGGVRHADDVRELALYAPRGVSGVVIGRALYDGALTLRDALAAASTH
jgi:phosphoribosylformimino-5-aminoimidazole carboxamide ribotide isomerase